MQRIFNKDGFNWWIGIVEDRLDPEQLGRVRVRIFGYHTEDKILLPTEDLPWAIPIHPILSAAASGVGLAPLGPLPGTWILGFFLDGEDMQQPAFFGCIGTKSAPAAYKPKDVRDPVANSVDGVLTDSNGNPVKDTDGNIVKAGVPPAPGWYLGKTSEQYDKADRGAGYINEYADSEEREGARYGSYQFISFMPEFTKKFKARPSGKTSPVRSYVKFSKFNSQLVDYEPGTSEFDQAWSNIASSNSEEFATDQYNYIKKAYYDVMVSNLEGRGFDATKFGPAVQDLIWSTAYHMGPTSTAVFTIPLADKSELTDKDIVNIVSEYKIANAHIFFRSKGSEGIEEAKQRFMSEKASLLGLITV